MVGHTKKRQSGTKHAKLLAYQAWPSNDQWHCHERQCIMIPFLWQRQLLKQLHSNYVVIEKTRLLARELVYWVNMTAADDLVKAAKIVFVEFGTPADNNFRCRHKFHIGDIEAIFHR